MKPNNTVAAEQAFLGTIIHYPSSFRDVCDKLNPDDFSLERTRAIFSAMLALQQNNQAIDLLNLMDILSRNGGLSEIGGKQYLASLVGEESIGTSAIIPHLIDEIKAASKKRNAKLSLLHAQDKLKAGEPIEEVLSEAVTNLVTLKKESSGDKVDDIVIGKIRETDLGNAMRLVRLHGADIRYCHAWHRWVVWDSKRWELDAQGWIKKKAKDTIFKIYRGLDRCPDKHTRERLFKHAIKSEADQRIKAMLSLAESEAGIPVIPDELDRDPWVLNCENGTLDLKTGALNSHEKDDLITKICPVSYSEDAECPNWLEFLNTVMDHNQDLIDFLQKAVGYSLTGSTREQCLFFLYGTGANGKTTFLEVILALLNDYSRRADFSTFLVKYGESIRNDLARLKGARFVSAIETAEGKRLAEGLVKQLTGQDKVAARFLRQEFFEFQPEFKIWLAANHKPNIVGSDYAIWRRMKVIPFTVTIPEKLQNPDLANELKHELPGILTWAVEGCLGWQEVRLREPKEVKVATAKYKADMDILGDFLKDFCTISGDSRVAKGELYKKYTDWCEQTGEKKMSKKKFGICLLERGFEDYSNGNTKYWLEIELRES